MMSAKLSADQHVTIDDAKRAIMTSLYGSKKQPIMVFGEGEKLEAFYETMETEVEGVWLLNEALLNLWNPEALSHDWVLPDNFHVKTKVMDQVVDRVEFAGNLFEVIRYVNQPVEKGLSICANVTHS